MRGFIFDFDGVIVDSERYWKDTDKDFFAKLMPGWNEKDATRMMGLGREAGFDLLTSEYGLRLTYEEYERQLEESIADIYKVHSQLLPGLQDLLNRLEQNDWLIGISSSSRKHLVEETLDRFGIRPFFKAISTGTDVERRSKPFPDVYLLTAERLGIHPGLCIAIEDSKHGIDSAQAAGMKCIGIQTDMNDDQDISKADIIVDHLDQVTESFLEVLLTQ